MDVIYYGLSWEYNAIHHMNKFLKNVKYPLNINRKINIEFTGNTIWSIDKNMGKYLAHKGKYGLILSMYLDKNDIEMDESMILSKSDEKIIKAGEYIVNIYNIYCDHKPCKVGWYNLNLINYNKIISNNKFDMIEFKYIKEHGYYFEHNGKNYQLLSSGLLLFPTKNKFVLVEFDDDINKYHEAYYSIEDIFSKLFSA